METENTDLEQIKEEIIKVLEAEEDVAFVYLFGSAATGLFHALSDIDIAVYLQDEKTNNISYLVKRMDELVRKLIVAIRTDTIDLTILNAAGSELAFSVIQNGTVILSKDEKSRVSFEERTLLEYFYNKSHFDEYDRLLFKRIKAG